MAIGLITEAKQAEDIVASGKADMSRWRAPCSTTRAGLARPRELAARSKRRRNTGVATLHAKGFVGETRFGAR